MKWLIGILLVIIAVEACAIWYYRLVIEELKRKEYHLKKALIEQVENESLERN